MSPRRPNRVERHIGAMFRKSMGYPRITGGGDLFGERAYAALYPPSLAEVRGMPLDLSALEPALRAPPPLVTPAPSMGWPPTTEFHRHA